MRYDSQAKEFYADKAVDLAHIIGGALVIGQFVSERFEPVIFIGGLLIFIGFTSGATS
jgi:hypothetical protein